MIQLNMCVRSVRWQLAPHWLYTNSSRAHENLARVFRTMCWWCNTSSIAEREGLGSRLWTSIIAHHNRYTQFAHSHTIYVGLAHASPKYNYLNRWKHLKASLVFTCARTFVGHGITKKWHLEFQVWYSVHQGPHAQYPNDLHLILQINQQQVIPEDKCTDSPDIFLLSVAVYTLCSLRRSN